MASFADTLRVLRMKTGMSQKALAREADVSASLITKLERGKVRPSWDTVLALCRALGVDCSAFDTE